MIKRYLLVIFLTLILLGGLFGWKFHQINVAIGNMKPPPPAVVAAATVQRGNWQSYLTAVGSLVAVAGIEVSSEVSGKVKAIHFESDQPVKKGQLLLELDESTDLAELEGLEANRKLAGLKFARSQKLIGRNFISKSDYDINKASLDEAKSAVDAKKAVIAKKRIVAPFAGQIGIRRVNVGQYLDPGASIAPLQQLQPMYADFNVPEQYLGNLNINQSISLSVRAYPGQIFNGVISAINPGIEEETRSVKLRATLENPDRLLRPGMFADVQIRLNDSKSVLTVPDTAITYNPYGDAVYVIVPDKQGLIVQLKQVTTGETREGRVEIVKGLQENDRIVSAGQVKLRNGMAVTLDKLPAPGERGATQ
jgi:membrane fusion protein (multidrug efflux system)